MRLVHWLSSALLVTALGLILTTAPPALAAPTAQGDCPGDITLSFAPTPFQSDGIVEYRLTNTTAVSAFLTDLDLTWAAWYTRNTNPSNEPRVLGVYIGGTSVLNAQALWIPFFQYDGSLLRDDADNYRPYTRNDGFWIAQPAYVLPPNSEVSIWLDFVGNNLSGPPLDMIPSDFNGTQFTTTCDFEIFPAGPDVNKDRAITPADTVYVVNRLGSADLTADVDGNGMVNVADVDSVLARLGNFAFPTASPPFTETATVTTAPTATGTVTSTPTDTDTPVPTATLTPTVTPSMTPTATPSMTPTNTITPSPTAIPRTFDCDLVTLAEADFDQSLTENERKIGIELYGVQFRLRNDNSAAAILQDVNLHWGSRAYWDGDDSDPVPGYPAMAFNVFTLNGTTLWTGTDALPDTDTANPGDGTKERPEGVWFLANSTATFSATYEEGPALAFDPLDRSDFSGTAFTIVNSLTDEPCPPLVFEVEPQVRTIDLIDAETNESLGPLTPGMMLPDATDISFEAITNSTTESVEITITGRNSTVYNNVQLDGTRPFAAFGDANGNFNGRDLVDGDYRITVIPHNVPRNDQNPSTAGPSYSVDFSVQVFRPTDVPPGLFTCNDVTLAQVDFEDGLSEDEAKIAFVPGEVRFRIRNDNNRPAELAYVLLDWNEPSPLVELGFDTFTLDGVTLWDGDDFSTPTDTRTDTGFIPGTYTIPGNSTATFIASYVNTADYEPQRSDYNGTTFGIRPNGSAILCPELTFSVGGPEFGGGSG